MPFDFNSAVRKQYRTLPVSRAFVPSSGTPKPQIMWVGCSDSFIIETETLDVLPEEIFVHRNLGNILHNGDLSSASALDWCLDLLKVCLKIVY
jgi:carbonic anhydrase